MTRSIRLELAVDTTDRLCGMCPHLMFVDGHRCEVVGGIALAYAAKRLACSIFGGPLHADPLSGRLVRHYACMGAEATDQRASNQL
jgi:hypothetical protein